MSDHRLQAMRDIVLNLTDTPADQDADFLAEVSLLAAQIKGLADTEALTRAMDITLGEPANTWPECGRGVLGDWCRRPVNHDGDCSPKSRRLARPTPAVVQP